MEGLDGSGAANWYYEVAVDAEGKSTSAILIFVTGELADWADMFRFGEGAATGDYCGDLRRGCTIVLTVAAPNADGVKAVAKGVKSGANAVAKISVRIKPTRWGGQINRQCDAEVRRIIEAKLKKKLKDEELKVSNYSDKKIGVFDLTDGNPSFKSHYAIRNVDDTITDTTWAHNLKEYQKQVPDNLKKYLNQDTYAPSEYEEIAKALKEALKNHF